MIYKALLEFNVLKVNIDIDSVICATSGKVLQNTAHRTHLSQHLYQIDEYPTCSSCFANVIRIDQGQGWLNDAGG